MYIFDSWLEALTFADLVNFRDSIVYNAKNWLYSGKENELCELNI